jgi:hypothetical protein
MFGIKDREGVGGFTESLLAISVVTVAVVLFTVTMAMNMAGSGDRERIEVVEVGCQQLIEGVLRNCSNVDGKALSEPALKRIVSLPLPMPDQALGYSIVVKDIGQGIDLVNVKQGVDPIPGTPIAHSSLPICIEWADGRSMAGLVEVSCW